jgi:hypothetical protein
MKRSEAEHVLRAAAAIAQENSFVIVGSQAVLFAFPHAPQELLVSRELDLYPALHPEKADLIDGAMGALSSFDQTFGYHADGVGPETATLPADWMQRAQFFYIGDITAICPEIHDLAVSKCVAGREKDADFVRALLKHRMVTPGILRERITELAKAGHLPERITQWLLWAQRRAAEAEIEAGTS